LLFVHPCEIVPELIKLFLSSVYGFFLAFNSLSFAIEAFFLLKKPSFTSLKLCSSCTAFLLNVGTKAMRFFFSFQENLSPGCFSLLLRLFDYSLGSLLCRTDFCLSKNPPGKITDAKACYNGSYCY
jgi:hypothetical protein